MSGASDLSYRVGSEHLIFGTDGSRYVLDPQSHAVHRGERKASEASFTALGDRSAEVNFPIDAAVSRDGHLYVVDHGNHRVAIFDAGGRPMGQIEGLSRPRGCEILGSGQVAVCDVAGHAVQLFTPEGRASARLTGEGDAALNGPCAIAQDPEGHLHVVDSGNCRVVVMDTYGEAICSYGQHGPGEGELLMPRAIAINSAGVVCVGEAATGFIHVFETSGRFISRFTPLGPDGDPIAPLELSFDPDGELYVWAPDFHGPMANA